MLDRTLPKSMDIQKPGATKPDSSSRPILVTNRPILQDPMVNDKTKEPEEEVKNNTNLAVSSKTVEPPKEAEALESEPEIPEITEAPKAVDSIPESEEPASSDSAVVDAVMAGATKPGDTASRQLIDDAEVKRRQAVQLLIDSKKYAVKTGQVTRARHNRNSIVLLVLILAVAIGYVVIDMGIVSVPFELPIQFFITD